MTLDSPLDSLKTTHLLNIWFMVMLNDPPSEYLHALPEQRAAFLTRLFAEIDRRMPIPGTKSWPMPVIKL